MNYYERFCGDYQRDTAELTLVEHGAYTMLLDTYYSTERPLPADYALLYRIARAMTPEEQAAVRAVADRFFPVADDGKRRNTRADREIPAAQKRIEIARANGKNGGRPKNPTGSDKKPSGIPGGLEEENPEGTQRQSSPSPSPEDSVTNVTAPDAHDLIWSQGVRLITASGKSEAHARSFLGKLCKNHGPPRVAEAVTAALINKPVEPVAYLSEVASGKGNRPGRNPDEDRSAAGRTRAAAAAVIAEGVAARAGCGGVAVDGIDVRAQVG